MLLEDKMLISISVVVHGLIQQIAMVMPMESVIVADLSQVWVDPQ